MTLKDQVSDGLVALGVYDALSAVIATQAGAASLYMSGFGFEATQIGAPDVGLMTLTELAEQCSRITSVSDLPLICDIDAGFGGVNNIWRTVRELERAGVSAVQIEDQTQPKRCPLLDGKSVVSREEAVGRVQAAIDARRSDDFLVIARTDADLISFEEMVQRSNLYLEAGADIVMPMMMEFNGTPLSQLPPDEQMVKWSELARQIDGPTLMCTVPQGYTSQDVLDAGFNIVVWPIIGLTAVITPLRQVYGATLRDGSSEAYFAANPSEVGSGLSVLNLLGVESYLDRERRYVPELV